MGTRATKAFNRDELELKNLVQIKRSKSVSDNQDDLEDCALVWLDSDVKYSSFWHTQIESVRSIISNLNIFNNIPDCLSYFHTTINDKIFLITTK
jgi:hypothetical protein